MVEKAENHLHTAKELNLPLTDQQERIIAQVASMPYSHGVFQCKNFAATAIYELRQTLNSPGNHIKGVYKTALAVRRDLNAPALEKGELIKYNEIYVGEHEIVRVVFDNDTEFFLESQAGKFAGKDDYGLQFTELYERQEGVVLRDDQMVLFVSDDATEDFVNEFRKELPQERSEAEPSREFDAK